MAELVGMDLLGNARLRCRIPPRTMHPAGDGSIASRLSPWYDEPMDTTPYDLTPEQKGMLASLSRETGKPIPALIAKALETLQEREHVDHVHGETNGSEQTSGVSPPPPKAKHIWEMAQERFGDLSEEDVNSLPVDGAAQHDHYIYGLPKRPA
jgi:hypothetical protein